MKNYKILAIILLIIAMFIETDYIFFIFLKIYIFIISIICYKISYEKWNMDFLFFIITAIFFNPFYFIPLWREIWINIDFLVILLFFNSISEDEIEKKYKK